jgi:cyclomaltodextrinase / maltogenic alpha-amylase / neopullulanase
VDRNFFEIAYSLERQFGQQGIYRDLPLYSFADNHDVNRVPSQGR